MIDWTKIKFISKPDSWFIEGDEVKLLFNCSSFLGLQTLIEDGWGLFEGMTNEPTCYKTELPRLDEEGCSFNEFNIYYNNEIINNITYKELKEKFIVNK